MFCDIQVRSIPQEMLKIFIPEMSLKITYVTLQSPLPGSSTQGGRGMHICVSELIIIGSNNGLSPERRQAIIWTNAGILLIGP